MPERHTVLPIEEGQIAIDLEELLAHGIFGHPEPFDDLPFHNVLADDLVQVGVVVDAVENLIGPDQDVRAGAGTAQPAGAKTTGAGDADAIGR